MKALIDKPVCSCWICGKPEKGIMIGNFPVHIWCKFKLYFTKYRGDVNYYIMDNSS